MVYVVFFLQVMIITVHPSVTDYANQVHRRIFDAGFQVEFDEDSGDTLNKRIRSAQLAQFNFILVLGQKEKENGSVNVRTRDNQAGVSRLSRFEVEQRTNVHLFCALTRGQRIAETERERRDG